VVDVGEYGLALEDIAAMLTHAKITVTGKERDDITVLAWQWKWISARVGPAPGEQP
jgi:hypothetical protein